MATRPLVPIDPNVGIPDLVRRLTDDSKRLARDEVRLAKLEMHESVRIATRGALWLGLSLGVGVVALVALTIGLVALVGRLAGGKYWVGALIVGVVELAVGALFLQRGVSRFGATTYSFPESRDALRETAGWIRHPRTD